MSERAPLHTAPQSPEHLEMFRVATELRQTLRKVSVDELLAFQERFTSDREIQNLVLEEVNQRYDTVDHERATLEAEERGLPPHVGHILGSVRIALEEYGALEPTRLTLIDQGFVPERRIVIDGREIWLSRVLQVEGGSKEICGAYVQTPDGYVLRTYVTSQSQGIWRYYPSYIVQSSGPTQHQMGWYVKGASEESLGLPWQLQRELARQGRHRVASNGYKSSLMLMGASGFRISREEYALNTGAAHAAAIEQSFPISGTDRRGTPIPGFPDGVIGMLTTEPEHLAFTQPEHQPDFTRPLSTWRANPPHYGPTTFEVYRSKDEMIDYTLGRTDTGKIWIAHAEFANAKQSSSGLKRQWIDGGVLTAPAIEYQGKQAGRFAGAPINGDYVDVSEKFQKRLPVIQDYMRARNIR